MNTYSRAGLYALLHKNMQEQGEYQFYHDLCMQSDGRPILELGCGTGRLLVPLSKDEFVIHGIDDNPEMLAVCAEALKRHDLKAKLWLQSMQELALDKKYGLILSALETFQQISDREHAQKALRRIHAHLKPGGIFCVYLSMPWLHWPEHAAEWREINRVADGGATYVLHEKSIHDPYKQIVYHAYRVFKDDALIDEYEIVLRWYARYEFEAMLKKAGFSDVAVRFGYEDGTVTEKLIFTARA